MSSTTSDYYHLLDKPDFPLSSRYDFNWMLKNNMGPNALWLTEWLTELLPLKSGMRVLDLGCGKALSSVFLAKEFDVQVWAIDLWMSPDRNWKRIKKAGVDQKVFPIHAEAHALPFPQDFFDAVVSIDAYQYFGTDELYLNYLCRIVKQDGLIGAVMPGLIQEFDEVPEHLSTPMSNGKVFWEDECRTFKTAKWWERFWSRNSNVTNVRADTQPDGWRHWRDFEQALQESGENLFPSDAEALDKDQGRYIGFIRAIAECTGIKSENIYDPALGAKAGVEQ